MSAGFIHLSDIHFGQETGSAEVVHDDIKQCVIQDVDETSKLFSAGKAAGVLVTGDIAYGGREDEYASAARWLDQIAEAAGCEKTEIQVVPGNHDVDRDTLSIGTKHILSEIVANGQESLDAYMSNETMRQLLYERFRHFIPFAEAYRCPLDQNGRAAEERFIVLAPGRTIRFVRLNSALVSYQNKEDGKLLLGESQHVIKVTKGEEKILLSHHPLNCFQDQDEAFKYVKSRARVFISGHEHNPSCNVIEVESGKDLMLIAAGATIPPKHRKVHESEKADYCYNLIEFDWDEENDGLAVKIFTRVWNHDKKIFEMGAGKLFTEYKLACPNFGGAKKSKGPESVLTETTNSEAIEIPLPQSEEKKAANMNTEENYPLLILRFFRDISYDQRKDILIKLGKIPTGWNKHLNEAYIRALVDSLVEQGRSAEIWAELKEKLGD